MINDYTLRLVGGGGHTTANKPEDVVPPIKQPAHVQATLPRAQKAFTRFETDCDKTLRAMTADQKLQHLRNSIFNAIAQAAKEGGRGQPPMVERFHDAAIMVDALEASGVPFGVCRNSRMNKALLRMLNDKAEQSADNRISRRKKIKAFAVRALLRDIRKLRLLSSHFVELPPYAD